ncbi:polymer-forming cytoskeletal protein [Pyruvatibacter sp.]|uniref:bactofilin family protein n=1 Tax=Pyruvatibacter sp. TaxID=1981328 RepID=UPI003267770C
MFSKKDSGSVAKAAPAPAPRRGRSAPSIISDDLVVHGNLIATGDIQIDGTVEGDVRSQSLTVGEHATITGAVMADDIVVRGRIVGSIRARRVQLATTCHVEGDILHEALAVETGAFFEGNCRHSDDPLGDEMPSSAPSSEAPASLKIADAQRPTPEKQAPAAKSANTASASKSDEGKGGVVVKDGAVVVRRPAAQ